MVKKAVVLEVEGITISGQLYLPIDKAPYPAVCVCHGIPARVPDPDQDRGYPFFSGGAAVSVYVASQDSRVSCVATCACPAEFTFITEADEPQSVIDHFRSIGAIRDEDFPRSAEEWLNGFRLIRPVEYVAGIAPRLLLLVHGSKDETVDMSHAYRLYDKAGEPKQMIVVDGAGHRLRQDDRAMAIVIDWLKSQCQSR